MTDAQVAIGQNINQETTVHQLYGLETLPEKFKTTEPSALQIVREIKALPPFDQHRAPEKYKGLRVLWLVESPSIRELSNDW